MFPNRSEAQLREIVDIVIESNPTDSFESIIENILIILTGEGAQGPLPDFIVSDPGRIEILEDESVQNSDSNNEYLYEKLLNFFKDISPDYLLRYCRERNPGYDFHDAIDDLSTSK